MTRDDVLKEFDPRDQLSWHWDALDIAEVMADEIVRLREALKHETQWADAGIDSTEFWQKQRDDLAAKLDGVESERDELREMVNAAQWAETVASAELEQLRRILAALREPSEAVMVAIGEADRLHGDVSEERLVAMLRAAVAAAEQEVQGER